MKPLDEFSNSYIQYVFTDIDGTLTQNGRLPAKTYSALWDLQTKGINVIPVTGRPAGWCDLIARFWPVHGVIGENGGLYFSYQGRKMKRWFAVSKEQRRLHRKELRSIGREVLEQISGARIAADQFCRVLDLAVDFAEDTGPLQAADVEKIQSIFHKHGAQAKISNIHVNAWFGDYDKLKGCQAYCQNVFGLKLETIKDRCAFVGDSPNDEPMFAYFDCSFAVANFREFSRRVQHFPRYISQYPEGEGFAEICRQILKLQFTAK